MKNRKNLFSVSYVLLLFMVSNLMIIPVAYGERGNNAIKVLEKDEDRQLLDKHGDRKGEITKPGKGKVKKKVLKKAVKSVGAGIVVNKSKKVIQNSLSHDKE